MRNFNFRSVTNNDANLFCTLKKEVLAKKNELESSQWGPVEEQFKCFHRDESLDFDDQMLDFLSVAPYGKPYGCFSD